MNRLWPSDEVAWGRECLVSGDSVEEIAQAAGCPVAEVVANIGSGRLNSLQRDVVSLYLAGATFGQIDAETGRTGSRIPGKASAQMITMLRRRGEPIPYRREKAA